MKRWKRFKVILSVLLIASLFYICIPTLYIAAETKVVARIEPVSSESADSDNRTEEDTDRKHAKDKKAVWTGDSLLTYHLIVVLSALALSTVTIIFLRYRKTEHKLKL